MNLTRERNRLLMTFGRTEGVVLLHALRSIRQQYQIKPSDLDSPTARALYPTRGCQSAGMSAEETQQWIANLFQLRGEALPALQMWITQLEGSQGKSLTIPVNEAHRLLTALNDHRLRQAACCNLGEAELTMGFLRACRTLTHSQVTGLCEIEILAYLIEHVLQHMAGLETKPEA